MRQRTLTMVRRDRRRFGDAGDRAISFVRAGDCSSVVQLGRSIMGNAVTPHSALWGLEWAAFGAIRAGDEIEMRHRLDEALQRFVDRRSDGPRPRSAERPIDKARAARIERELDRRARKLVRRPGDAKPSAADTEQKGP